MITYVIFLEDGSKISVADSVLSDNLNPCIAITATVIGSIAAIAIVAAAPVIEEVVTHIVDTVVSWVRSFWSWLCGLFTTTTVITQNITYPVVISGVTYTLKKYDEERYFDYQLYYLVLADTDDGFLYVSTTNVSEKVAQAVLYSSTLVSSGHKNSSKKFVLSIYTANQQRGYNLAYSVGAALGDPGVQYHPAGKIGYFEHYHPGEKVYRKPHCFYGGPAR